MRLWGQEDAKIETMFLLRLRVSSKLWSLVHQKRWDSPVVLLQQMPKKQPYTEARL